MDAVQRLNEKLQKSGKSPASFRYVKFGTNYSAETYIDGLLYLGNICSTKESAAESCAESYFANIMTTHFGRSLVDCRSGGQSRWRALGLHMACFVTDDENEMKMLQDDEQAIFGPNCDSLMIMRLGQLSVDEYGPLDIVVYTDSPTVREFVTDIAENRISYDLMLNLSLGEW